MRVRGPELSSRYIKHMARPLSIMLFFCHELRTGYTSMRWVNRAEIVVESGGSGFVVFRNLGPKREDGPS